MITFELAFVSLTGVGFKSVPQFPSAFATLLRQSRQWGGRIEGDWGRAALKGCAGFLQRTLHSSHTHHYLVTMPPRSFGLDYSGYWLG